MQDTTFPKSKMSTLALLKLVIFVVIFISIPIIMILLGQITRKQIKADVSCKQPYIPDPKDCVGGEWKLIKDENSCLHFQCQL